MTTAVLSSKSGLPTLQVDGRFWHSSYDPVREAAQWASSLKIEKPVILLIGDGLGYAEAALRDRFPGTPVAVARVQEGPRDRLHWDTADARTARVWLSGFLNGQSSGRLQTLVWPAALSQAPSFVKNLLDALTAVLREEEANLATYAGMGRIWLANAINRALDTKDVFRLLPFSAPIVLAASGPSLADLLSLPQWRTRYRLVALASAVPALAARGWTPDASAQTDGGYWAGRLPPPERIPLMAPASAAVHRLSTPWAPFTQGYHYERFLFGEGVLPDIPARGTVTYSALACLEKTAQGPIIAAGLDLCDTRGRRHLSPHPIDDWLQGDRLGTKATHLAADNVLRGAKTLAPGVTQTAAAALYASGFECRAPKNRFRLNPSAAAVSGFVPLSLSQLDSLLPPGKVPPFSFEPLGAKCQPKKGIFEWKNHIDAACQSEHWDDPVLQEAWVHLVPRERSEILQAGLEGRISDEMVRKASQTFQARWSNLWRRFLR